ncbi:putative phage tail protein [Rhizobium sp. RU36D]|uniref:putative phage tail protein n=1 Tax=Rhizobium sp. RU36D TaxID=1907415 RepID=UPI0009D838B9|nr:putative phage tail protein [Rhizobium sp. RU36D]SMD18419.1 Uncharacterized protein YmfQ in lambdoid prophage, DUF2313 family [Rhizobium sp. RU36D]
MRDSGLNTRITVASAPDGVTTVAVPWDVLANPGNDDLLSPALAAWPQGPAWGTPDGEAMPQTHGLARLTRVIVDTFQVLYAKAYQLIRESSVSGVSLLLPEWERDFGLPDKCVGSSGSVEERIRALEAKVAAGVVATGGDFIRLAASYGFVIDIEEPAIFECGFSECGGEHTVGDARQETYWIVRVTDLAVDYFLAGEGECGFTPLFSYGEAERLICLLQKYAPGWTTPVLYDA